MIACLSVAAAYAPPLSAVTTSRRAVAPSMQATKKLWSFEGFDDSTLFEAREVAYERPPVKILSRLNEMKVSTTIADLGLLSAAEDAGVFSKLESAGAFSAIEKTLPLVEKLGLLSILEEAVDTEAGLIFTGANFLIAAGPTLLVLQICGFLPKAEGIVILPEALLVLGSTALGVAFFVLAFIASVLQDDDQEGIKLFR